MLERKKSINKLAEILSDLNCINPISITPYIQADKDRSERILTEFLS